jgi:hypothetical protein
MWRNALRLLIDKSGDVLVEAATRIGADYGGWEKDPLWSI